jgi:hypothetical protein
MNISVDVIKQFADARQKLMDSGVISSFIIDGGLHVSAKTLVDEEGLKVEIRDPETCAKFPYEISVTVEGIKIFGLLSEEEFAKYPQLQSYMVDDVDLSGGGDHAA